MKRFIAWMLVLILLMPMLALGEKFSATDAADARRKALRVFRICGFSSEQNNGGRDYIVRWEEPIRICVAGKPTRADLKELDGFLMELSLRVPGLPPITRVDREADANIVIHYCKLREMRDVVPDYEDGNWGSFHFTYRNYRIVGASIGIAVDKCDQRARNHLMREELVGALGLANDHEVYSDSILYQKWTTVQTLSDVDWIMLNFLYSPLVSPGDKWPEAERAIRERYGL